MKKSIAVIYHYYENDRLYKENLIYFLCVGILPHIDYYIFVAGDCTIGLPELKNVTYINMKNWNNDFGGHIKYVKSNFSKSYSNFIFINSSVRGPFLPHYMRTDWTDVFTDLLKDDIHLVGSSINILSSASPNSLLFKDIYQYRPPYTHVQTTAFALSAEAFQYLIDIGFYDVDRELTKDEVIIHYELRLSQEILKKGWNFTSILPVYSSFDYRLKNENSNNTSSRGGDTLYKDAFYSRSLTPLELIFIKVNRDIIDTTALASITFTGLYSKLKNIRNFADGYFLFLSNNQIAKGESSSI